MAWMWIYVPFCWLMIVTCCVGTAAVCCFCRFHICLMWKSYNILSNNQGEHFPQVLMLSPSQAQRGESIMTGLLYIVPNSCIQYHKSVQQKWSYKIRKQRDKHKKKILTAILCVLEKAKPETDKPVSHLHLYPYDRRSQAAVDRWISC